MRPKSGHDDVSLPTLDPIQLLNPVNHVFIDCFLVVRLDLNEDARLTPAGVRAPHPLQEGELWDNVTNLPRPYVD